MPRSAAVVALLAVFTLARPAPAQQERYELGLRLREAERAWLKADEAGRRRSLTPLKASLRAFFTGNIAGAARGLDETRFALESADKPSPEQAWAASLAAEPSARLVDAADKALTVRLRPFYDEKAAAPAKVAVHQLFSACGGADGQLPAGTAMTSGEYVAPRSQGVELPAPPDEGDGTLTTEVTLGDKTLASRRQTVSIVGRLKKRLAAVRDVAFQQPPTTADAATLRDLATLLTNLANGWSYETDYPAARLLAEAEALAKAVAAGEKFYGPKRAGQFWLTLPTPKSPTVVRVLVPPGVTADKPVPLVVALHGMGGSENLFFDGYGDGAVVKECAKRGWLLAAPRSGVLFGAPPVGDILDELAKLYPFDRRRVYLVGHSMGAAQTVAVAQEVPDRVAAGAALGGGGGVRKPERIKPVPMFVGCGTEDFALAGAKVLAKSLKGAGSPTLEVKEYADVEHMMVVPAALADVFAFFERAGAAK